jgi:hypothetical protein
MTSVTFDPWAVVSGLLFELGSDDVQRIVGLAGLNPDWTITEKEAYSHTTRNRVYRGRVGRSYSELSWDLQQRFIVSVAKELIKYDKFKDRLNETLQNIGWTFIESRLVKVDLINPSDLLNIPQAAHEDLSKAGERLPSDVSGAITSACSAVESVCNKILEGHEIKDASFQEKVKKALDKVKILDNLKINLIAMGWEEKKAGMFCENLRGAVNQAAYVMQTLRSEMGDVHGSKPFLPTLAFDSIKWSMIISSLLQKP